MIAFPWDIVLTVAFTCTGVAYAYGLVRGGAIEDATGSIRAGSRLLDANHMLMSVAMISMICWHEPRPILWVQVGLFGLLGLAMLSLLNRQSHLHDHLEIGSHLSLNAAMIWMLATMALMQTHHHHGHAMGESPGARNNAVSAVFIVLSAGALLRWAYKSASTKNYRWHVTCHVLMAAGMVTMLAVMV